MIDAWLEGRDLSTIHTLLTIVGFFLSAYVMQLTSYVHEDGEDPWLLRRVSRLTLVAICLSMLWSLNYSEARRWQPWPPDLAMLLSVIFLLGTRAIAIHARLIRNGDYWPFERTFHARRDAMDRRRRAKVP
jgi:hypothetical protein